MRFLLAVRCFFKVLASAPFAQQVQDFIGEAPADPTDALPSNEALPPRQPQQSEAITLLASLQREARFVDLVCESLAGYSDAQIGAAARDVLQDSGKVLNRFFALQPVSQSSEGAPIEVPAGYDPAELRLTGDVSQALPLSGQLMHAGWKATRCELPSWTGSPQSALVVAPAEIQIK